MARLSRPGWGGGRESSVGGEGRRPGTLSQEVVGVNAEASAAWMVSAAYNASMVCSETPATEADEPTAAGPAAHRAITLGLLPAGLLMVFAFQLGTFPGAAHADRAIVGHLLLLMVLISVIRSPESRPRLSARAWIVAALGASMLVGSNLLSPVPRAGWTGLALLPAWLALPFWMASCWRRAEALIWGLRGLAAVLLAVSAWALIARGWPAQGPAAMPLGHHNLLAAFLIPLIAMASALWFPSASSHPVLDRILTGVSVALGAVALIATGSLAGALVLVAMVSVALVSAAVLLCSRGPARPSWASALWILATGLLLVVALLWFQADRLWSVFSGADLSLQARSTYWLAGWQGFKAGPWWGWGPGAGHWNIAEFMDPIPGINPPGQVVADLHCLPLQLLYELGMLGCLGAVLLVGVLFSDVFPRLGNFSSLHGSLFACAAVGGLGIGFFSLAGFPLDVPALPMAVMPCFAVLVLGSPGRLRRPRPPEVDGWDRQAAARIVVWVFVAILVVWQGRRDLAHRFYDQALTSEHGRVAALERAHGLDTRHPLYAWQLAQEISDPLMALQAAESARGLGMFWLTAGDQQTDERLRIQSWRRSSELDPFGAPAPFRLAMSSLAKRERLQWATLALALEPLLVSATAWSETDGLLVEAAQELAADANLNTYWRERLLDLAGRYSLSGDPRKIGLRVDAVASESLSLFAFRRRPWPRSVGRIEVDAGLAGQVDLQPNPGAADRLLGRSDSH